MTHTSQSLQQLIDSIAGTDTTGPSELFHGLQAAVASPTSEAMAAEMVAAAASVDAVIIPAGSWNLGPGVIAKPARPVLIISSSAMNQVLDHQPDDMTITCQSGVTVDQANLALSNARQMLAQDVPLPATSTLGGMVASASAGLRRFAYGAPRDQVIGLRAVTGDGKVIKAGGKVVKNVAGYDVCKLFTGSFGTLGFITEITQRVRPVPEAREAYAWHAHDLAEACAVGLSVHLAMLAPTMIVVSTMSDGSAQLVVGMDGAPNRIAWQKNAVEAITSGRGLSAAGKLSSSEVDALQSLPAGGGLGIRLRASVLPSDVAACATNMIAAGAQVLLADCACGIIHAVAPNPEAASHISEGLPATANLRLFPGSQSAFEGVAPPVAQEDGVAALNKRIKAMVDPDSRFASFPG